ncbi:MAG: suppressor of fused domain protein [Spirochaetes bacterium]|nr:suppressor of fused domain protein [Spirochaetota bacterium]
MDGNLLELINEYHERNEHAEVINRILSLKKQNLDYTMTFYLANAYSSVDEHEHAVSLLLKVRHEGEQDPEWHCRLARAYSGLNNYAKTVYHSEAAAALDKSRVSELSEILAEAYAKSGCLKKAKELVDRYDLKIFSPEVYTENELSAVSRHIERHFGKVSRVLHEVLSPDIRVDIMVVEPQNGRNYLTLVTSGMGAHKMNVPQNLLNRNVDRAELIMCLPPEWDIGSISGNWFWPLLWMKIMARLPIKEDSWLGWGHTVPNSCAFADNTCLSGIFLDHPHSSGEESFACKLNTGEAVNFYQMIPLYDEEMEYKIMYGTSALLGLVNGNFPEIVDVRRKNFCSGNTDIIH